MLSIFQQKPLRNNSTELKIHYPAYRNKDDEFYERSDLEPEFHHALYLSLAVVGIPFFVEGLGNIFGLPQKFWITEGDTAYSFNFNIISGTGIHVRPHFFHELKSIGGGWIGTGVNTDLISINGTYHRAALDSLFGERGTRISDHGVDLSLNDVTGPRGSRRDLSQKVSGSITGLFTATVTILKENVTIIREIEREISIQLGSGQIVIRIGDEHFIVDPHTGGLK